MTERKFFGAYYHLLLCYAPNQLCIFSGRAINFEKEEASFNFLKITANLTSNRKPDLVLYNRIVRFQVQNKNDSLFLFWLCNFPVLDINLETFKFV